MDFLKIVPFLTLGTGLVEQTVPVSKAIESIFDYCQSVNKVYHSRGISQQELVLAQAIGIKDILQESKEGQDIHLKTLEGIRQRLFIKLMLGWTAPLEHRAFWFPIPAVLHDDRYTLDQGAAGTIIHIASVRQEDSWSCPLWMLFTASALRDCVKYNSCLDVGTLHEKIRAYYATIGFKKCISFVKDNPHLWKNPIQYGIPKEYLPEERDPQEGICLFEKQIHALFRYPELAFNDDIFLLTYQTQQIWPSHLLFQERFENGAIMQLNEDRKRFFKNLCERVKKWVNNNEKGVLHFICRVTWVVDTDEGLRDSCHYILISLLKLRDRNPILIVSDSINKELASYYDKHYETYRKRYITPAHYLVPLYFGFIHPYVLLTEK